MLKCRQALTKHKDITIDGELIGHLQDMKTSSNNKKIDFIYNMYNDDDDENDLKHIGA